MQRRASGQFQINTQKHHEVKGLFFIVARKHLIDAYGEEAIGSMADAMSPEHRVTMLDPMHSEWYPEEALQQSLAAFHDVVARGSDQIFLDALQACTLDGINRFFQILIGLTSPAFVLRKCPVLWRFVRRGPGWVDVEADDARAMVRYRDFPYFDDRNYRLLMEGTLRGVAGLALRDGGRVEVKSVHFEKSSLDVEVVYGESRG